MLALIDCNNFFVSCERLFDPTLRGRPVVVLSNNDGCVISRSNEAKALQIAMCQPAFTLRDRPAWQEVLVRSANFGLYADLSRRVMAVIGADWPERSLAVHSVDEAFLDLGDDPDPASRLHALRARVLRWVGIPVSIGIAPTKTLAKLINDGAKRRPDGVLAYDPASADAWLSGQAPEAVWGIGERLGQRLRGLGIANACALRDADPTRLQAACGVTVVRTLRELRGEACLPLHDDTQPRRSLMVSRSFGREARTTGDLRQALSAFSAQAAARLRRLRLRTRGLGIWIVVGANHATAVTRSDQLALAAASDDGSVLASAAGILAQRLYRPGERLRKAGVLCTALESADTPEQQTLFAPASDPRRQRLLAAIDQIHADGGGIASAAELGTPGDIAAWRPQQHHRSGDHTTDWAGLRVVC